MEPPPPPPPPPRARANDDDAKSYTSLVVASWKRADDNRTQPNGSYSCRQAMWASSSRGLSKRSLSLPFPLSPDTRCKLRPAIKPSQHKTKQNRQTAVVSNKSIRAYDMYLWLCTHLDARYPSYAETVSTSSGVTWAEAAVTFALENRKKNENETKRNRKQKKKKIGWGIDFAIKTKQ